MNITDIRESIKMVFNASGVPSINEINEAINECIRNINGRTPAQKALITLTGINGDWNVDNINLNVDDIEYNVEDMSRFNLGFKFESDGNYLEIPDNIISIKRIYIDDVQQIPKPYDKMMSTFPAEVDYFYQLYGTRIINNAGYFTQIGRKIYFQKNLNDESSIMKMEVEMEYDEIKDSYLSVPNYFKQYLISNSIVILGSLDKNHISNAAYQRHIIESERFFNVIINRGIKIEQSPNLDIW